VRRAAPRPAPEVSWDFWAQFDQFERLEELRQFRPAVFQALPEAEGQVSEVQDQRPELVDQDAGPLDSGLRPPATNTNTVRR
jgi:hypothetical protein